MAQANPHALHATENPGATTDVDCCWPGCGAPATISDLPVCLNHALTTFGTVMHLQRQTFDEIFESRPRIVPQGTVYFVRFADRIKIGFSTDVRTRLEAIPHDEVLLTIDGSREDEKRFHAEFAHLRSIGEWFRIAPELLAFIEDLKAA